MPPFKTYRPGFTAQVSTGAQGSAGPAGGAAMNGGTGPELGPGVNGPGTPNVQQGPPGGAGTGFVNLQNILGANKEGIAGIQKSLADKANRLGSDAQSAYDFARSNASQNYNKEADLAHTKDAGNMLEYHRAMSAYDDAKKRLGNMDPKYSPILYPTHQGDYETDSGIVRGGPPKAPGLTEVNAPGTLSGFMGQGAYGGLQNQLASASAYANGLNSAGGRQADLGQIYGKTGQYSNGMSSLDSLLSGQGVKNGPMGDAASKYGNLKSLVGNDSLDINSTKGGTNKDGTSSTPMPGAGPTVGPGSANRSGQPMVLGYPQAPAAQAPATQYGQYDQYRPQVKKKNNYGL